jgi:hypothetical protein
VGDGLHVRPVGKFLDIGAQPDHDGAIVQPCSQRWVVHNRRRRGDHGRALFVERIRERSRLQRVEGVWSFLGLHFARRAVCHRRELHVVVDEFAP